MALYGLKVWKDGRVISDPSLFSAGFYVGSVTASSSQPSASWNFPDVPAGALLAYQSGPGQHDWSFGSGSSGEATITLTKRTLTNQFATQTTLHLFARTTREPDYGVLAIDDYGNRAVSTIFPSPEFVGRVTFSGTPTNRSNAFIQAGYWKNLHTSPATMGQGRLRLVLWSLPSTSADVWTGGAAIIGTNTSSLTAEILAPNGTAYTPPEAFVFALNGHSASAEQWGIRARNSAGQITYDGGLRHMVMTGLESGLQYPAVNNASILSFTKGSFGIGTPAILIPFFQFQAWAYNGDQTSTGILRQGYVRRRGNTLDMREMAIERENQDINVNGNFQYGMSTGLLSTVINAAEYGGTPFA